jgi:hypothetical protein
MKNTASTDWMQMTNVNYPAAPQLHKAEKSYNRSKRQPQSIALIRNNVVQRLLAHC